MIPAKLIEKKRDGFELNAEEIEWFVEGTVENKIDDLSKNNMLKPPASREISFI